MWPTHYIPKQDRVAGTPPPRFYLTTPPYPIEVTEEIQGAGLPADLGFVPFATAEDDFRSAGVPVSGSMSQLLVATEVDPDDIQSAGIPVSGALVERLVRITAPDEEVQSTGVPIGGTLRDPLVVYDNWPLGFDTEDLQSAGIPVSGVLS